MQNFKKPCFILLLFFSTIIFAKSPRYYNTTQYLMGERAAGMAGAYSALANDSMALWYNPAGLARIERMTFHISANTYSYIKSTTKGFMEIPTHLNTKAKPNLTESDLSVVANTLVFGKKINKKWGMAVGVFVPYQDTLLGVAKAKDLEIFLPGTLNFKGDTVLNSKYYEAIIGAGVKTLPSLSIGMALSLGYYLGTYQERSFIHLISGSTEVLTYEEDSLSLSQLTFALQGGGQYQINKNHWISFNFKTPAWRLYGKGKYDVLSYSADTLGADSLDDDWLEKEVRLKTLHPVLPASLTLGYAYSKTELFSLSLDISLTPKSTKETHANKTTLNFKAGAEFYLSSETVLRTGVFSDFSQNKKVTLSSEEGASRMDFYGATFSFSFANNFIVIEKEKTGVKTLWSTFGIAARYGRGQVLVDALDLAYDEIPMVKNKTAFNIQVFIAESIHF